LRYRLGKEKFKVIGNIINGKGRDEAGKERHRKKGQKDHVQKLDDQLFSDFKGQAIEILNYPVKENVVAYHEQCPHGNNQSPAE
jgi:hypothetical protein